MTFALIALWIGCVGTCLWIVGQLFIAHGHRTIFFAFLINFLAQMITLPLVFDSRNILAVGANYSDILRTLPFAATIYLGLSTLFMVIFYVTIGVMARRPATRPGIVFTGVHSMLTTSWLATLAVAIQAGLVVTMFMAGIRYGGLTDVLQNPIIRPVSNFWSIWSFATITVTVIRVYLVRSPRTIVEVLLAIALSSITGQRGVSLIPIALALISILSAIRSRGFITLAIALAVLVPAALLLSNIRNLATEESSHQAANGPGISSLEAAAFTNNFSDIRDFAWVLGTYRGPPLGGRTYVAGYTPFIPSGFMPLRREWGFGTFTVRAAGLDESKTGGLRTGLFSEVYFNFGIYAAVLASICLGLLTGKLFSDEIRREYILKSVECRAAGTVATYIIFSIYCSFIFTPTFFGVLVLLMFISIGYVAHFLKHVRLRQAN